MISQMIGVGTSHAKVILIGEHAVVYGQPAIAMPLPNLTVTATLRPAFRGQVLDGNHFHGELNEIGANIEGLRQLILRLLDKFGVPDMTFTLSIETNIPQERGLGASAALATAVTKAFFNYFNTDLSETERTYFTDIEETITHGSPSGLDAATVHATNPVWFVKNKIMQSFDMHLSGTLVIADTGIHGQTIRAISVIKEQLKINFDETYAQIEHLGSLSDEVRLALVNNQPAYLGELFSEAHRTLRSLGVSHPRLDKLVTAAINAGALGAKLTGAGVGGAMFVLAKNNNDAITIANALNAAGAQNTWIQPLS